jgi:hypothetical protein
MALPAIHISDLPDAGPYDPKDKLQFQRNVLGTWQDFHTDIETYFGPVLTATYTWDGTDMWFEVLDTTPDFIVPLEVYGLFTPGPAPTSQIGQVDLSDASSGSLLLEVVDNATIQAVTARYVGAVTTLPTLQLLASSGGFSNFSGTMLITIRYVVVAPI